MNVDTKKSNMQVVIMRLLGELAAKAGATDLPLGICQLMKINRRLKVESLLTSRPQLSPMPVWLSESYMASRTGSSVRESHN